MRGWYRANPPVLPKDQVLLRGGDGRQRGQGRRRTHVGKGPGKTGAQGGVRWGLCEVAGLLGDRQLSWGEGPVGGWNWWGEGLSLPTGTHREGWRDAVGQRNSRREGDSEGMNWGDSMCREE